MNTKAQEISTHDLLVQLKSNCVEALNTLYPRYAKKFYSYARRKQLSHEDAEDVVSATFDLLLTCIQSYNEVIKGGERWMWAICRNQTTEVLRARRKQVGELFDMYSSYIDPETFLEQKEHNQAIKRAWERLTQKDRQEILQGRGRGPGRKGWHEAMRHFRTALSEEEE